MEDNKKILDVDNQPKEGETEVDMEAKTNTKTMENEKHAVEVVREESLSDREILKYQQSEEKHRINREKEIEYKTYETYDYGQLDQNQQHEQKKNRDISKNNTIQKLATTVLFAIVFGVVAGLTIFGVNVLVNGLNPEKQSVSKVDGTKIEATELIEGNGEAVTTDVSAVAKNVMPSVVSITNLSVQEVQYFFFGTQQYETESSGSGIIIGKNNSELLIVTNYHVVENSKTLTTTFIDGESVEATIKGMDSDLDLAILSVSLKSIKNDTLGQIKVATIGDSEKLVVGEPAIAIGNALGYGQSVTSGIISALNRELEGFDAKLVQTDAAINPGNSGGALLNIKGEVIGINTVKVNADAVEGMGYAIPISDVQEVIETLMNKETKEKVDEKERGVIGISGIDVDATAIQYYNMPAGVYINEVVEGGAAEKAGISKGSIITKIEGSSVKSMSALKEALSYYKAGETVELEIAVPGSDGEYEKQKVEVVLQKNISKTE